MGTKTILLAMSVAGVFAVGAAADAPDYLKDIRPILAEHCLLCHGPDEQKGGMRLDSFAAIQQGGESGAPLSPGNPEASLLYQAIAGLHADLKMPPEGKKPVPKEKIALIKEWIAAGAVGPTQVSAGSVKSDHWAFMSIASPTPPSVQTAAWVRNPIDNFVLAQQEAGNISPAPEAERATLLRRLHLDLTGLPPTPQEVDAFLADTSEDAYTRTVDALLASPHFGERWARHWLDLARYADSDGYEKDTERPWAWRYRNWVIDAINSNKPYNEFVIEQLAGDLLPNATLEQIVATGFHRNTLTNKEGGVDQEEYRVAQVVDRANTTMQALMGVTMNCAQCHTHKYDPFTHAEYYQLYSFFNNEDEVDIKAPLPPEKAAYDAAVAQFQTTLAALETERDGRLEGLAPKLSEWEKGVDTSPVDWQTLQPETFSALSGATMTKLGDGSILVNGAAADKDTYTVQVVSELQNITTFQLETLLDGSLPQTGPGRASDGNFVLSSFKIASLPDNRKQVENFAISSEASSPDELNDDGGSTGDKAAVDGSADTFWDEVDGKPEYRFKLNFKEEKRIGSISISGYKHQDYAPKDFKILLDGEEVHTVTGAVYENNFFITDFRKKRCTTLELVITGYYGGSPAIRELGVYEQTSGFVKHSLQGADAVKIESAVADVEQGGFPVEGAIDDNLETGWAPSSPTNRANQSVRFFLAEPQANGKTKYTFTLDHQYAGNYGIGRFRISATTDATDKVRLGEAARLALKKSPESRSDDEKRTALLAFGQFDPDTKILYEKIAAHKKAPPQEPKTMAQTLAERKENPRETHIHIRGDFLQKGDLVNAGTPAVFPPIQPRGEKPDRLDLANWIVSLENPLTARVQVNRVWRQLFGTGLVRTPEDFGTRGEMPTHPELLDWLARNYMNDLHWNTKDLIRLLVHSSTYRQSSRVRPELEEEDPDNRLIARQGSFRVEAEIVRDLFLASSGLLKADTIGGPSMRPFLPESMANLGYADTVKYPASPVEEQRRRSLYIQFTRTIALPMLMTFDCPDSNVTNLKRERSNTPLQALTLMNDPVFVESAQGLGKRLVDELSDQGPSERLRYAFKLCLSREPNEMELNRLLQAFEAQKNFYKDKTEDAAKLAKMEGTTLPPEEAAAYVTLARAIMNLDEFINRE